MRFIALILAVALLTGLPRFLRADDDFVCLVTNAPDVAFVPPSPYESLETTSNAIFLFGTADLWTVVNTRWQPLNGNKIPYFSQGYDAKEDPDPRLQVVARRLDKQVPLQWADWANGGGVGWELKDNFLVTGVGQLDPGCWEISAHFNPSREKIATLSFTVIVE